MVGKRRSCHERCLVQNLFNSHPYCSYNTV